MSIKGCYFHFCQALLRKVQDLGLQSEYRRNSELRSFVQKAAAVAFVPLRYVRLGWIGVKAVLPNVPRTEEFVVYFQGTWISGNYPPATWNVHDLDDCRTNDLMEGWHSKLKNVLGKAHPNVYEIVRTLKAEQAAVELAVAQLGAGACPPPRSHASIDKDWKVAEMKRKFAANEMTLQEYIWGLACHTNFAA